jgi:hypothetical protein
MSNLAQSAAHLAIRGYQLTLSGLIGRQCRHLPSCSEYTDEAIQRHGFWAGGWVGLHGSAVAAPSARRVSISCLKHCPPPPPGISRGPMAAGEASMPRRSSANQSNLTAADLAFFIHPVGPAYLLCWQE